MRLVYSNQLAANVPAPDLRELLEAVSEQQLRDRVKKLSVPRNLHVQPEANQATARWLAGQFEQWEYSVEQSGPSRNVVALPKILASEMIVVGAHYDSVPQTPGADDNASAVAALLGCAEVLAPVQSRVPVCYVAFNGEESGLVGSADFVSNFLSKAGFKIVETHILEMVGFASAVRGSQKIPTGLPIRLPEAGDFLGLLANQASAREMDYVLAQARTYLPDFPVIGLEVPLGAERVLPVLARSDHVPFWQAEMPAVMWTDTSEFRNPHYHQSTDTPDTLDYAFLRRVTQLLVACLAERRRR